MAKNLPLNAKDFYEGKNPFVEVEKGAKTLLATMDEMQKKLVAVNQELGKSMRDNTKETSKDYQVLNDQLSKSQQNTAALNKINEEKARLEATLLKLNKQSQQENEELNLLIQQQKKNNKDLARETLNLVKPYEKLTKQTNEAQKKFKNLAAEFGVNSKQAKAAKAEFEKLDGQLRKVNDAAKDGRRDVGRYAIGWQGVKKIFSQGLGLLGITAGLSLLKKGFEDFIASSQNTADAWDMVMSGMRTSYNKFYQLLKESNYDNFFGNLKNSYEIGKQVSAILDEIYEKQSSFNIQQLNVGKEIEELERDRDNVSKTETERREAALKINEKSLELAKTEKTIKEDAYKAWLLRIKDETTLTREEYEYFVDTYNKYPKLRDKSLKLIELQDKRNTEENRKNLADYEESLGKNLNRVRLYANSVRAYNKAQTSTLEETQKAREEYLNVENEYLQTTQKNQRKLDSFEKELQAERERRNNANINNLENLRKKVSELTTEIQKGNLNDLVTLANKQAQIDKINKEIETIENLIKAKGELKEVDEIEIVDEEIKIKEYDPSSSFDAAEKARQDEINAEIAKFEALKSINESGYSSIFDIFSKYATKKKAADDNLSAEEIQALNKTNQAKVQAVEELVNTLISIYTELLDSRIQDLETEINATNQKINETEQALNRETSLQEQGAANNVAIEKQKLERLQQERDKDLQEQKKLQKERDKVNKLTQISSLITAIANIINQYSNQGPQGWILGLLAASAAVIGYISASGEAESAVGEEGELLTKKGTYLESGKRHSRGGNKYSSAEFEEGEAHAIFSRDATRRNYKDIKQFTDLVNSGKWDLYKSQIGGNLNSIIVNNDYEKLLNEQRKTNQILQNQIRPVYNNKGKLVKFNINGVMIKAEI
jgi:DNA repair exonuclease SbcCD ATPase subunit